MKGIQSLSLRLWLPLWILAIFLSLWGITTWKELVEHRHDLMTSSLQFVRHDMASLQREMDKEHLSHNHINAQRALTSRGVINQYKELIAIDSAGTIIHALRLGLVTQSVSERITEFEQARFERMKKLNRADVQINTDNSQITAYFPLALERQASELRPTQMGALFFVYDLGVEQARILQQVWRNSLAFGGILLLAMLGLIWFINRFINAPINHLVAVSENLATVEPSARSEISGSGEIARLGDAFNLMVEQLRQRFEERRQAERLALEQSQLVRDLLDSTAEAIYGLDLKGNCTFANPQCVVLLGYQHVNELIGKNMHQLIHHSYEDGSIYLVEDCPIFQAITTGKGEHRDDEILWRADGSKFPAEYWSSPIKRGSKLIGAVVNFLDISQRKQAQKQIQKLSMAIEQSPVSVTITDVDANIEYVNKAFEAVTGYSAEEVVGKNSNLLQSGETSQRIHAELWKTVSKGQIWQGVLVNRKKSGETFWEQSRIAPITDSAGNICNYVAVKEDITLQKRQQEQILHQAHFDTLTDLPNRFLVLDRLAQLLSDCDRSEELVVVAFLDLDDFKKINDSLGHEVGDRLLIEAGERLETAIRSGDTVGRLGGDEFIVLLRGFTVSTDSRQVVEGLLNQLRKEFRVDGRVLNITASIGVAVYPGDGDTTSELLRNADSAMYHAKKTGRNTYSYFTQSMNQEVSRRLELDEHLHGALERGEFQVVFQSQVEINSERIIGAEALLRWHNPKLGTVSPVEFIPIAENNGLIIPIGQFVLEQSLQTFNKWFQAGHRDLRIAVNLSPRQFRDPELLSVIEDALNRYQVASENLELEITEGVLMSGHIPVDKTLRALSDLGIKIAMDDFGTGYSSLNYLRRYPFDILKIDRSFVNDLERDPAARELINATIAMAHGLGLKVIAEGVETDKQLGILNSLGCDIAQGYYFSKPVAAEDFYICSADAQSPAK